MKDRFRVRAWNEIGKYYLYDVQNSIYLHNRQRYTFVDAVNKGLLKKWKLEQCSGFKNKNGQLIYEGDIVVDESYDAFTKDKLYKVAVDNAECYSFLLKGINVDYYTEFYDAVLKRLEIIGNIHKNAELLEAE